MVHSLTIIFLISASPSPNFRWSSADSAALFSIRASISETPAVVSIFAVHLAPWSKLISSIQEVSAFFSPSKCTWDSPFPSPGSAPFGASLQPKNSTIEKIKGIAPFRRIGGSPKRVGDEGFENKGEGFIEIGFVPKLANYQHLRNPCFPKQ